jgi:putative ABC transport system substrate-binding protein
MRRRLLVASLGAAALARGIDPTAALAQTPGRTYRVGALLVFPREDPSRIAMMQGLASQGFVEGRNLAVDERSLDPQHFAAAAQEFVQAKVDLLVAGGPAIATAQKATTAIPIVGLADDMVQEGYVGSLANRSGNTTGISILATELDAKRFELLMELLPAARRLAVLADARLLTPVQADRFEASARQKGVALSIVRVAAPGEIAPGLKAARDAGAEGVNILGSPMLFTARRTMFDATSALRLPTVYQWPEGAAEGALVAYGPRYTDTFRQWGVMAGKVLRGTKPSALPVEQPSKFDLVVNLKAARTLGLAIPPGLLTHADEVIE